MTIAAASVKINFIPEKSEKLPKQSGGWSVSLGDILNNYALNRHTQTPLQT